MSSSSPHNLISLRMTSSRTLKVRLKHIVGEFRFIKNLEIKMTHAQPTPECGIVIRILNWSRSKISLCNMLHVTLWVQKHFLS